MDDSTPHIVEIILQKTPVEIFLDSLANRKIDVIGFKQWYERLAKRDDFVLTNPDRARLRKTVGRVDMRDFWEYQKLMGGPVKKTPMWKIEQEERQKKKRREKLIRRKEKKRGNIGLPRMTVKELREMAYDAYLKTAHWLRVRERALTEAKGACRLCNSRKELHVHHRTYKTRGCEQPCDVVVLCEECHREFHHWHGKEMDH